MADNSQPRTDLDARIIRAKQNQASQYQCHLCPDLLESETVWWTHLVTQHTEELPTFATDEDKKRFRKNQGDVCRQRRVPKSSHLGSDQGQSSQTDTREGKNGGNGRTGITKGIETLHLANVGEVTVKTEDADMAEPPMPPAQEARRKDTRRNRQRGGASAARGSGRNSGNRPDPDFDRTPVNPNETPSQWTLYNPNNPAPPRRLVEIAPKPAPASSASAPNPNNTLSQAAPPLPQSPGQNTPKTRNRRRGGGNRAGPSERSNIPTQPNPQNSEPNREVPPPTRESGTTYILKNISPVTSTVSPNDDVVPEGHPDLKMVRQPETRPITADQLLSEVKGIYAGLVMVEAKCLEVDGRQAAQAKALEAEGVDPPPLTNEQWQALIALHRTLLFEHHDFFLASQHPSASPALRRLAARYAMPARMWRHGIHSFLELLRHRLPLSLEHMLSFIYLAYSIIALLYETVPAFEETWIECLGDLGRYRMAIEDDDYRDREVWTVVARTWYGKAADRKPTTGRLYHHIAILARPHPLQQLFYYSKALTVAIPFAAARESILSLFDPVLSAPSPYKPASAEACHVALHAIWFTRVGLDRFDGLLDHYLGKLDENISSSKERWSVPGCLIAISNIAALYQYNSAQSKLRQAFKDGQHIIKEEKLEKSEGTTEKQAPSEYEGVLPPLPRGASSEHATPIAINTKIKGKVPTKGSIKLKVEPNEDADKEASWVPLEYAIKLAFKSLEVVLQIQHSCILPHVHAWLVFLFHNRDSVPAMRLIERDFPWKALTEMLNELIEPEGDDSDPSDIEFERDDFPVRQHRPLPEDWTLRGLEWTQNYFPDQWIEGSKVDDEERELELPSFNATRKERILWLAYKVAMAGDWMEYDSKSSTFSVHTGIIERIENHALQIRLKMEMKAVQLKQEDLDVELDLPEASNSSEGFDHIKVPEDVKNLAEQKLQLQTQLDSGKIEGKSKEAEADDLITELMSKTPPREALQPNYTALVVDTNFLLNSAELFKLALEKNEWSIVIPNTAVTELKGLSNNIGPVGAEAKAALTAIQEAIQAKKDLKIVTAKGNELSGQIFYKEKLEEYKEDEKNIDDVIIDIANQQGLLRAKAMQSGNRAINSSAKLVALVTNDVGMRVKATVKHVYAISGSELKECVDPRAIHKGPQAKSNPRDPTPATTHDVRVIAPEASSSSGRNTNRPKYPNKRKIKRAG